MVLSDMGSSWLSSLGQLMSVLAIFFVVLLLTWFVSRWIAGYQQGQMRGQNLRVVETLRLTANSYIQIIEAGDVYLVIAVSKDRIEKLAELDKEQLKDLAGSKDQPGAGMTGQKTDVDGTWQGNLQESFHDILDKVKQHLPKK